MLKTAGQSLGAHEVVVLDAGASIAEMQTAKVARYVVRLHRRCYIELVSGVILHSSQLRCGKGHAMDQLGSLEQFAQYLERRAPGRRTAINYVSDIRQFLAVCAKPWREVTMHDIDAFVDGQRAAGRGPATVKRRVAALKVYFDFLTEESGELSRPNPVRFKRHAGKQPQGLPRDLSDERIAQLWAVITAPRDQAWFALMWRAGLRVSEVTALQLADVTAPATVDEPARLRVCGKGQKERLVLLSADAYAVLATWLTVRPASDQPYVFLNERGHPLAANGIEWLLHRYGVQAGVTVTPHQLRHTFARQVTEAGMPITSLGKLLGHAQVSTTQIYTAGADPALRQAYLAAMTRVEQLPPAAAPPPSEPAAPAPAVLTATFPAPATARLGGLGASPARRTTPGQPDLCAAPREQLETALPTQQGQEHLERLAGVLELAVGAAAHQPTGRTAFSRSAGLPAGPHGRW